MLAGVVDTEARKVYEGFEEKVIIVGGGGIVEKGGMVGITSVFYKEIFGLGVLISGLCYLAQTSALHKK